MKEKLLRYCEEKNILLDGFLLDLFSRIDDLNSMKILIEKIKNSLGKRFLTKKLLFENKDIVKKLVLEISLEKEDKFKELKEKLNLEKEEKNNFEEIKKSVESSVKIISSHMKNGKSLEVKDFVNYFKGRYNEMSSILQERNELENLTSINKLSNEKQKVSLIGMIRDKQTTKNNNVIFEIEDLTGSTKVMISANKLELLKEAEDISLDSVIGFKGLGSKEILFVNEIIFPETHLIDRKNSPVEEHALFIADLHYGSFKFMEKSFNKFIDYLNNEILNSPEVSKIKYLFIIGDLITGVGNYPNQEKDLAVPDLEEQFIGVANLLNKIRKDIKIIIIPGNHDCVRIMEPQPLLDERYAWPLYQIPNVLVAENPSLINIGQTENFPGFNVLCYHGFSFPYYANNISKLMVEKTMNSPEKIMKYLLKQRHLAPTHGSTQYFPSEKDHLFIKKIPDIFVAGHTHKSGVTYENNVLVISASTWEGMTSYQEKFGNKPDHCKVPMFNLKTRAVKILDFELEEEGIKVYKEDGK